jgi:hypothetical protein
MLLEQQVAIVIKIHICRYPKTRVPLLLYKGEEPTRLSLSRVTEVLCVGPSHDSPQTWAATQGPQQRPTPPHRQVRSRHVSRGGDIPQGILSGSGPPLGQCSTPVCTNRTSGCGQGPPHEQTGPLGWDPDPSVRSGPLAARSQDRTCMGLGQDPGGGPVKTRVWTQSGADMSACATTPRPGGDPMLPRGLPCMT